MDKQDAKAAKAALIVCASFLVHFYDDDAHIPEENTETIKHIKRAYKALKQVEGKN